MIAETLTEHSAFATARAQNYLPAIRKDGDKRAGVVDGGRTGTTAWRVFRRGETRGNLAAGGRGEPRR